MRGNNQNCYLHVMCHETKTFSPLPPENMAGPPEYRATRINGAQRASGLRSLVDYLGSLGCQDVKVKEGCSAGPPGSLLVQSWAAEGVLVEHHKHPLATPLCARLGACT